MILLSTLLLVGVLKSVRACDVEMPYITLSVQFQGNAGVGSQKSENFVVPLYDDCDYIDPSVPIAMGMYHQP